MTPLVLLFIGLSVKFKRQLVVQILSLLFLRAGLALCLSCLLIYIAGISSTSEILFVSAFSLSACSFWPFAHIASISVREKEIPKNQKTFDTDYSIAILAFSLPISVALILLIFSTQQILIANNNLFFFGTLLLFIAILPPAYTYLKRVSLYFPSIKESKRTNISK